MRWTRYIALLAACVAPQVAAAWDSSRLSEPVMINGHIIPYPVFAIFVMPGTPISAGFVDATGGVTITFKGEKVDPLDATISAPREPGLSVLELNNEITGDSCRIHVFTLVPAKNVGR